MKGINMKYIITGGAGFIGSHLVELILSKLNSNDMLYLIDNLSTGHRRNISKYIQDSRVYFIESSLGNALDNHQNELANPDYIYHLAGIADIVPSIENPKEYFKANVEETISLLEFIRAQERPIKKLVYAASSSCYGIPVDVPTPENAAIDPKYPYALTKRMGEELVLHWASLYDIPAISLRLFNVYGPRSQTNGTYGAVFGVFMAQILANKPLTIVGDGTQSRDFTFVTDVANAFWCASQSEITNEVFNIGSGNHYSINKLAELLNHPSCPLPKRPGEPDQTFADISKVTGMLQWKPQVSFEEGVKIVKENIHLYKDAPLWDVESIEKETKSWFKALSDK